MNIPEELLKKIYEIEIITKRRIDELSAGAHRSIFSGEGSEFEKYREYGPGDDVRRIDWHLLARFPDKVYIKCYEKERQLMIWVLADLSGSIRFGFKDLTKKELLVKAAAYLGFSAARVQDEIGQVIFTDKVKEALMPASSKGWIFYMLDRIWNFPSSSEKTDITLSLKEARSYFRKSDMVFLLSDFLDENCFKKDSVFWEEVRNIVGTNDLIPVVFEENELFVPDAKGNIELKDLESGKKLAFHLSKKNQKELKEKFEHRHNELRDWFMEAGARAIFIKEEEGFDKLFKFFQIRKRGGVR